MPKRIAALEISLSRRPAGVTLTRWLLDELRRAIHDGALHPGSRLPATRDLARQYDISRGTVVSVFEQLTADGYLISRVGSGAWVNPRFPGRANSAAVPHIAGRFLPEPMAGYAPPPGARPFRMRDPGVSEFPFPIWNRLAARLSRQRPSALAASHDLRGLTRLRRAIAAYLGASRGVTADPAQIVITTGVQQTLDLTARLLLKPNDPVWFEDPGYFGALIALRNARARIIPVPVRAEGIDVAAGARLSPRAKLAYVTPAHQFPLGVAMSLDTRLDLLAWARRAGAWILEDDYDSEYRFEGSPVPTLHSLDSARVILTGTFNKLLFPSLALGYVVLPPSLVDDFVALRYGADLCTASFHQAILCEFMLEGHLARHLRRMRELYGARLAALLEEGRRQLAGLLEISPIQAGLYTAAYLRNGMSSRRAELAATAGGIEVIGLHRFVLNRPDPKGLLLGFAAFDERATRAGVADLAAALGG